MTKKRKSPIRHKVRSHTRKNTRVSSFMRGHRKLRPIIRRIVNKKLNETRIKAMNINVDKKGNKIMYHVSPTEVESKIMTEGLKPTFLQKPIIGGTEGPEPSGKVLYFAVTSEGAKLFSEEHDVKEEQITMFEVKIPKSIPLYDDPYGYGESVYIREPIAPSKLKILYRKTRT